MCKCCGHCGKSYIPQEFYIESIQSELNTYVVLEHTSQESNLIVEVNNAKKDYHNIIKIPVYFCPICGRKLK